MLTIEVCHPDSMPSDDEVRLGIDAAKAVFNAGGLFCDAERAAITACFAKWAEVPESATLTES